MQSTPMKARAVLSCRVMTARRSLSLAQRRTTRLRFTWTDGGQATGASRRLSPGSDRQSPGSVYPDALSGEGPRAAVLVVRERLAGFTCLGRFRWHRLGDTTEEALPMIISTILKAKAAE